METEAREKAAQMRISNFYRSGTGEMNPETIYFIKEKHASREIPSLEVNGIVITDPEEIARVMQDWYENTMAVGPAEPEAPHSPSGPWSCRTVCMCNFHNY